MTTMEARRRVYVAGSRTMIGRAVVRSVEARRLGVVVGAMEAEPDLTDRVAVEQFFDSHRPDCVIVAAGRSAGIRGNQRFPAELMLDSLAAAVHVIPAAWRCGVRNLLYLASSCVYPRNAAQPLQPSALWSGPLEPTSAAYATAKLAGIGLCDAYRRQFGVRFVGAIGADAFGPGDDFDPETAHVVAALIHRIHEAHVGGRPSVDVWGSGSPRRDLIFVDDLADACVFALQHYEGADPVNLTAGRDVSIAELARDIRDVVGYRGELRFDRSKPDGVPFKALDSAALRALGWQPSCSLRAGLERTYRWFVTHRGLAEWAS